MLATRRKASDFPTGKTFDTWDESASSTPVQTQHALRTLEWIGRKGNVAAGLGAYPQYTSLQGRRLQTQLRDTQVKWLSRHWWAKHRAN